MIDFYIVHNNPLAALRLQQYLQKTLLTGNIFIVAEKNYTVLQPSANSVIIIDAVLLLDVFNLWIRFLPVQPILVAIGSYKEEEHYNFSESVFAFIQSPASFERILSLVQNIYTFLNQQPLTNTVQKEFLFIKSDYKLFKVYLNDVLFLAGLKDYTQIYLKNKKQPLITLKNLKEFENTLSAIHFIRVHRSYIVALNQIDFISKNEINIANHIIPVGNAYRQVLESAIEKNS